LNVTLRHARPADAGALAHLAEQTFRATFAPDNRPEDMDHYCAEAFSTERQRREIQDPRIATLVVEDGGGALIAYAQLREDGAPSCVDGDRAIELSRFYVDGAHHGRGLAQSLMEAVLAAARERGAARIWLGVWERNQRAQAFYRKTGFVDVGAHEFQLGADLQTDRVMVRDVAGR
jgi:ribosomal protein S18 acetylase RimI-like enzyme